MGREGEMCKAFLLAGIAAVKLEGMLSECTFIAAKMS